MPSVEALYREMAGNNDFVMITILYKESPENGIGYMKSNDYTLPLYVDSDGISARNYGVTGVPETYIVDKKGMLVRRVIGAANWNSPEEKNQIKAMF